MAYFHYASLVVILVEVTSVETNENCTCGYYSEYAYVGPFCEKWIGEPLPVCLLAGREKAHSCPGAVQFRSDSFYYTLSESVRNKSVPRKTVPWNLSARQPFEMREIVAVCLHSFNIFLGTVGNAFVIRHFASRDAS